MKERPYQPDKGSRRKPALAKQSRSGRNDHKHGVGQPWRSESVDHKDLILIIIAPQPPVRTYGTRRNASGTA